MERAFVQALSAGYCIARLGPSNHHMSYLFRNAGNFLSSRINCSPNAARLQTPDRVIPICFCYFVTAVAQFPVNEVTDDASGVGDQFGAPWSADLSSVQMPMPDIILVHY